MDVLAQRENLYDDSAAVWSRVAVGKMSGWISAISFNNAFYLTRKASGIAAAADAIRALRLVFQVVPLDLPIIDAAMGSDVSDFEDAIQYVSARAVAAHYLVTRNKRDFRKAEIPVVSPAELLAFLAATDQR